MKRSELKELIREEIKRIFESVDADYLYDKKGAGVSDDEVVTISENTVTVKLSENSERSYSFFNDVKAETSPEVDGEDKFLKIIVSEK